MVLLHFQTKNEQNLDRSSRDILKKRPIYILIGFRKFYAESEFFRNIRLKVKTDHDQDSISRELPWNIDGPLMDSRE